MIRRAMFVAAVSTVLVGAWIVPAASVVTDDSPPTWVKNPTASIPVGAVLSPWECEGNQEHSLSPVYVDYRAIDPESSIDHYEVITNQARGPMDVGLVTRVDMGARTTDPADCSGGGRRILTAVAVNGAGLSSPEYVWESSNLRVIQDRPKASLKYTDTWSVSTCKCWSNGKVHKTTEKGATAQLTFEIPTSDGSPTTWALGLVMAKGPDRGSVLIRLDGVRMAIVSANSDVKVNRTVVRSKAVSPGTHTLRLVNQATAGHPRIDVDAFVLLPRGSVPSTQAAG
jgi:hypothetical protein